jgi:lipoate---protein ligase
LPAWSISPRRAPAAELHALELPAGGRHVWLLEAVRPALVLGSTQPDTDADTSACAAAGVEVARRRSGGGAVLVGPGECVWVDVLVPRGDALWHDDVGRAGWWLGDAWAAAMAVVGVDGCRVHRGGMVPSEWSKVVCFAGLGPGEVVDAAGAKVVGISQRRTRAIARFQCAVPLRWEPARLSGLLTQRPPADAFTAVHPVAADPAAVIAAFLAALP